MRVSGTRETEKEGVSSPQRGFADPEIG